MSTGLASVLLALLNLWVLWKIAHKPQDGWRAMFVLQAIWVPYDILTGQYGFLLMTIPACVIAWRGFWSVRRR